MDNTVGTSPSSAQPKTTSSVPSDRLRGNAGLAPGTRDLAITSSCKGWALCPLAMLGTAPLGCISGGVDVDPRGVVL